MSLKYINLVNFITSCCKEKERQQQQKTNIFFFFNSGVKTNINVSFFINTQSSCPFQQIIMSALFVYKLIYEVHTVVPPTHTHTQRVTMGDFHIYWKWIWSNVNSTSPELTICPSVGFFIVFLQLYYNMRALCIHHSIHPDIQYKNWPKQEPRELGVLALAHFPLVMVTVMTIKMTTSSFHCSAV